MRAVVAFLHNLGTNPTWLVHTLKLLPCFALLYANIYSIASMLLRFEDE